MNVLVTGAAGRLGSETVIQLVAAGHGVVATDVDARRTIPVPLQPANLLDGPAVAALMQGVDAVIHLGNHTGIHRRSAAATFNENVAMNMNVFQAALESGVRKIVFSSSVQVIAGESWQICYPPHANHVAYLPLDEKSPPNLSNAYAMSKFAGETILKEYLALHGGSYVSLRFPRIIEVSDFPKYANFSVDQTYTPSRIAQGFSVLSRTDSAAANVAALMAPLPGFHSFFPAISAVTGPNVAVAIERYYPGVPLTKPIDQIDSLIDVSAFTRATGWIPRDTI